MNDFVPGDPNFERSPTLNVENISEHGDTRSHTRSKNCQTCHQEQGPGKGIFTISGTLLDEKHRPYPNAILELYESVQAPGGGPVQWGGPVEVVNLLMKVEVDANGNFYTTESLPDLFPNEPLYPRFVKADGTPLFKETGSAEATMGGGVTVGGCNFCHNDTFPIVGREVPEIAPVPAVADAGSVEAAPPEDGGTEHGGTEHGGTEDGGAPLTDADTKGVSTSLPDASPREATTERAATDGG
jgi:hypothetical protein